MSVTKGAYVLATKYDDGDPEDHWCVGFYSSEMTNYNPPRHEVVDENGRPFRHNGFRKVKIITEEEGEILLKRMPNISISLWDTLALIREGVIV